MADAYLFEYKRAPSSWDGDPAPSLAPPNDPPLPPRPPGPPNGDLAGAVTVGSLGELLPVEVPDIG